MKRIEYITYNPRTLKRKTNSWLFVFTKIETSNIHWVRKIMNSKGFMERRDIYLDVTCIHLISNNQDKVHHFGIVSLQIHNKLF